MTSKCIPVLSIAGSDSSGGAGIQADIKTMSALGAYAMTVITAVTAQNTLGVDAIESISPEIIKAQIRAVYADITPLAVKTGMLGSRQTVEAVADGLAGVGATNVIVDPVLKSTSGCDLSDDEAMAPIITRMFPISALITPNLIEARRLTGLMSDSPEVSTADETDEIIRALHQLGARSVLVTGVVNPGNPRQLSDMLSVDCGKETLNITTEHIDTPNTHGTGCTLSSAIATYIAMGHSLAKAVELANAYVHSAIEAGATMAIGHGHGPLNHFYKPTPLITI